MAEPGSRLSRAVSTVLRHTAWQLGLEPDQEGWVDLDDLVDVLRAEPGLDGLTSTDVVRTAGSSARRRFELSGNRIRALYGHSYPLVAGPPRIVPPATLFHGTARGSVPSILRLGLRPRGRQFVHMAASPELAELVGGRKDSTPAVLVIDARGAEAEGTAFYGATDEIYLACHVPPRFLTLRAVTER
jgi:putative RNA 2'-phosphotransferase